MSATPHWSLRQRYTLLQPLPKSLRGRPAASEGALTAFGEPSGARLHVEVDEFAGNSCASLGFTEDHEWFDPVTILSSPIGDETLKQRRFRVVAVFPKGVGDSCYGAPSKVALKDGDNWEKIVAKLPPSLSYLSLDADEGA